MFIHLWTLHPRALNILEFWITQNLFSIRPLRSNLAVQLYHDTRFLHAASQSANIHWVIDYEHVKINLRKNFLVAMRKCWLPVGLYLVLFIDVSFQKKQVKFAWVWKMMFARHQKKIDQSKYFCRKWEGLNPRSRQPSTFSRTPSAGARPGTPPSTCWTSSMTAKLSGAASTLVKENGGTAHWNTMSRVAMGPW